MPGTTTRWGIPYPLGADNPAIQTDFLNLANSLDDHAKDVAQNTFANRPVSTPGSPGKAGRYFYATDTLLLYRDFGTGWKALSGQEIFYGTIADIPGSVTLTASAYASGTTVVSAGSKSYDGVTPVIAEVHIPKLDVGSGMTSMEMAIYDITGAALVGDPFFNLASADGSLGGQSLLRNRIYKARIIPTVGTRTLEWRAIRSGTPGTNPTITNYTNTKTWLRLYTC